MVTLRPRPSVAVHKSTGSTAVTRFLSAITRIPPDGFSHAARYQRRPGCPAAGFGMHGHRDMEIITYVLEGALQHRDSLGTGEVIRRGDVQRMTAGTGIRHSEFNPSQTEPVHFLQVSISRTSAVSNRPTNRNTFRTPTNAAACSSSPHPMRKTARSRSIRTSISSLPYSGRTSA